MYKRVLLVKPRIRPPQVLSGQECVLGVHAIKGELNPQRPLFFTPSTILVQLRLGVVHSLLGQYINVMQYNTRVSVHM